MSEKISLNPDELTLGDLEDFEEATGKSIQDALKAQPVYEDDGVTRKFDDKGRPLSEAKISAKTLSALVWLVKRQANPDFTLQDARRVRVAELIIEDSEPEDSEGND